MRTIKGVEYMAEGQVPGWCQGFVTVWIMKATGHMLIKHHKILNYKLEHYGQVLRA